MLKCSLILFIIQRRKNTWEKIYSTAQIFLVALLELQKLKWRERDYSIDLICKNFLYQAFTENILVPLIEAVTKLDAKTMMYTDIKLRAYRQELG